MQEFLFYFNDTAQMHDLTAEIWDGDSWVAMIDEGAWYRGTVFAQIDVLCIRIVQGAEPTSIEWLWSEYGS